MLIELGDFLFIFVNTEACHLIVYHIYQGALNIVDSFHVDMRKDMRFQKMHTR